MVLKRIFIYGLALAAPAAFAKGKKKQKVHDHGHMKLGVAVEGDTVAFTSEIPGVNTFGFEHAAHTDAEKKAIKDALATLRDKPTELFVLPADLGCKADKVDVKSSLEGEHGKPEMVNGEQHGDVDTSYTFKCAKPVAGSTLKLGLLKAFPTIQDVLVQVNSGATQSQKTVKSADDEIKL